MSILMERQEASNVEGSYAIESWSRVTASFKQQPLSVGGLMKTRPFTNGK